MCKRTDCERCYYHRRSFFVERGFIHATEKKLTHLVTVSWLRLELAEPWLKLIHLSSALAKALSGLRAGPFIRVISLGERRDTPHVHYLVGERAADLIRLTTHRKWSGQVAVQIKEVNSIGGALGYMSDKNFRPSQLDTQRPKGIRLLSASRPMTTGFPNKKQMQELARLRRLVDHWNDTTSLDEPGMASESGMKGES